ncbi:MAG: right-handed parallel beta-helix repeat-containing protein [Planctomycetes bacterium]|nr:right-handed parallel beta-helix repeat-containing protein [Planctomycetota bacterium]
MISSLELQGETERRRARCSVSSSAGHLARLALLAGTAWLGACGRLALDAPGVTIVPPPDPLPSAHPTVGLVSAVAAPDRLRADWRVHSGGDPAGEYGLFVGTSRSQLFDEVPVLLLPEQRHAQVLGLVANDDYYVGLAQRADAGSPWVQSGPVLSVRTAPVLYVDPTAPGTGDGTTPAAAFNDLTLAMLTAFVNGGGNIYVRQGDLTGISLPHFTAVHVYGGFSETFRLSDRDALEHPTRLVGLAGLPIVDTQSGPSGSAILDGFELDGVGVATDGVSSSSEPVELRSVSIHDCQRGVKLRAQLAPSAVEAILVNVTARSNVLEGISVDGVYDLALDGCLLDSNGNEGLDLNHLVALDAASSSLVVRGSRFDRNGTEGLDCHLGAPAGAGTDGGSFDVRIQDCDFEANALDGVRIDIDYELFPQWNADIVVRGCRARANRGAGVHFDLDSQCSAYVHRLSSSANQGEGLLVTSETFPGQCTVSASAFHANVGAGARSSLGHFGLSLAHCVFAGNSGGGVASDVVPSITHSCVFDRQPLPHTGTSSVFDVVTPSGSLSPFDRAADEYVRIDAWAGSDVAVTPLPSTLVDTTAEVLDDEIERAPNAGTGAQVTLDPAPTALATPAVLALFRPSGTVVEDWRLPLTSVAARAGLSAPGGAEVDCGPFGAVETGLPGVETSPPSALYHLASTVPAWADGVTPSSDLELVFRGGVPEATTLTTSIVLFDAIGGVRPVTPSRVGEHVLVPAPSGGWQDGDVLALFPTLLAEDGARLAATVVLPIRVP